MISHGSRRSPFLFAIDDDERSLREVSLSRLWEESMARLFDVDLLESILVYIYMY